MAMGWGKKEANYFFCFFVPADLDTDKLLKKDLVTLDEAVKTANNAVLLAITAVSVLKSVSLILYHLLAFQIHDNITELGSGCQIF